MEESPSPSRTPQSQESVVLAEKQEGLIHSGDDMPDFKGVTEDVDDVQECEHFDSRESFLSLCQGNHYQFDQLRRAKHSSMMVLYHLHNPDAPKFVHSCNSCHMDILLGARYHCDSCEFDFCGGCKDKEAHPSPCRLRKVALCLNATPIPLTEDERQARQQTLNRHLGLLLHTAHCSGCDSKNCVKMKVSTVDVEKVSNILIKTIIPINATGSFSSLPDV